MNSEELKARTKLFALNVISLVTKLPKNETSKVINYQILKSSTSVGANYRAACRAKSKVDFVYKINIVEEEADETLFWLEIINESNLTNNSKLAALLKEADELTAIFTSIGKSSKR